MKSFNKIFLSSIFAFSFVANSFGMHIDPVLVAQLKEQQAKDSKLKSFLKSKYTQAAAGFAGAAALTVLGYKNPEQVKKMLELLKTNGSSFWNYLKSLDNKSKFLVFGSLVAGPTILYNYSKAMFQTIKNHKKKTFAALGMLSLYVGCEMWKKYFGVYPKQINQLRLAMLAGYNYFMFGSTNPSLKSDAIQNDLKVSSQRMQDEIAIAKIDIHSKLNPSAEVPHSENIQEALAGSDSIESSEFVLKQDQGSPIVEGHVPLGFRLYIKAINSLSEPAKAESVVSELVQEQDSDVALASTAEGIEVGMEFRDGAASGSEVVAQDVSITNIDNLIV